ncbi:MAG: cadmium-translocating P-type ATPase [Planctomycetia bacterium]|nr:cadmium-translocating P-type ATPase [Planctomycetia bacterium]
MDTAQPQKSLFSSKEVWIALGAVTGITVHLVLRFGFDLPDAVTRWPLFAVYAFGAPLVLELLLKMLKGEFGSDLLAGISIVTSTVLHEYLAGAFVVLMLSGGAALESYAVARASSVLRALAGRMPATAHRRRDGKVEDVAIDAIEPGDVVVVHPHETCPVDGVVLEGRSTMDESYLTGEPFLIRKTPGAETLSGAVNGEASLAIRAVRKAADSRFARIMRVMRETEQRRPKLRRLGDRLGAVYTPLALVIAGAAAYLSHDPSRFLAVLVVATPCPLLIAIPVALLGGISLAARRGIVVRDPAVMERVDTVRTIIFDKTGTLTYGAPRLTDQVLAPGTDGPSLLKAVAALERASRHPLASAITDAARAAGLVVGDADEISEKPGEGLRGRADGREIFVTGRNALAKIDAAIAAQLPPAAPGLECVVLADGRFAALYRFHDAPRDESRLFVGHLGHRHGVDRILLVSGDREQEVAWLAREVGITEVHAGKSPEEKVAIVREETKKAPTLFLGDGINDAPALLAATVGIAFGQKSDVTSEAAGAVIMDASLTRVDEFFHLCRRMRGIALQSAVGGMLLSVGGMGFAAFGFLTPVAGAIAQEAIDLLAVLNALRVAAKPRELTDF